jgi:SSS family solute:Na+ symporter
VLLTALGFYMWPHSFGSIFTARSDKVFRQNAIVMPLYQLILAFVFFAGFAAVLKVPGLTGPSIDLALFRVSMQTFDPWFVGVIGAAGVVTALVPGSMIMMTAATLLANNIYRPLHGNVPDRQVSRLARRLVPAVALVAVFFTLQGGQTIVALLLMGYSFVTQLFPALVMSLRRHNPLTSTGVFAGIVVGIATVAATSLTHTTIVPRPAGSSTRPEHRHRRAGAERGDPDTGQCDRPARAVGTIGVGRNSAAHSATAAVPVTI